jgi:hypothetical protein
LYHRVKARSLRSRPLRGAFGDLDCDDFLSGADNGVGHTLEVVMNTHEDYCQLRYIENKRQWQIRQPINSWVGEWEWVDIPRDNVLSLLEIRVPFRIV